MVLGCIYRGNCIVQGMYPTASIAFTRGKLTLVEAGLSSASWNCFDALPLTYRLDIYLV
jgi:hypothetical protein